MTVLFVPAWTSLQVMRNHLHADNFPREELAARLYAGTPPTRFIGIHGQGSFDGSMTFRVEPYHFAPSTSCL
ncbi:hypothetical protein ACFQPB_03045 [Hydrogenophaga atypica]|uniref:Uncharacterized protein n=1 Tax=Hydrogenophaga atypica TaxID=249409 RepID=A0ABW2QFY0_9BURK